MTIGIVPLTKDTSLILTHITPFENLQIETMSHPNDFHNYILSKLIRSSAVFIHDTRLIVVLTSILVEK
jgi:hypothetical protein